MGSFYDLLLASKLSGGGGGGGDTSGEDGLITGSMPELYENSRVTTVREHCFRYSSWPVNFGLSLPNVTLAGQYAFADNTHLKVLNLPKCESLGQYAVYQTPNITEKNFVFPKLKTIGDFCFRYDKCISFDFLGDPNIAIGGACWANCGDLAKIIIRCSTGVVPIGFNSLTIGTKYANGGAGGEVYIPKAYYDHLGDGTADDYKAATNWSTLDGYGTITWKAIEGSIYENAYADGTPIS